MLTDAVADSLVGRVKIWRISCWATCAKFKMQVESPERGASSLTTDHCCVLLFDSTECPRV